jgi:predicted type IV restriction endonuclease
MEKELFNPKTVMRLCSKINLTVKQKTAAKEWLSFLEQGKLTGEKINYPKFMIIVLQDLLGYDIKNMPFEEGNIEFSFANKDGKTVLGIEAKGTKTKDLFAEQKGYRIGQDTAVMQLWTYMGTLGLQYGIATNYKDFVLLNRQKGLSAYHTFDFEDVKDNEEKLKEFVAIFSKEQILDNGFIEQLEEASIIEEKIFTKEFYKLFHETRLMLLKDFQDNGLSRDESLHYAQLYMNRLMFIFFAEDTDKIEKRVFEDIVSESLKAEALISAHSKLVSDMILNLFRSLDEGEKVPRQIFGFDGELFGEHIPPTVYFKDIRDKKFFTEIYQHSKLKKEPELDENAQRIFTKYRDKINPIIKNLLVMASFDFQSEVSVNILGHIFEQSLADLEELKEEKPQKRKKEGIFYTPEYITEYICRNTIIPYLSKKNANTSRDLVLEHADNIKELEDKFKELKILDPACGSGAFLIKAVDVLLEIHKEIQIFKQDEGEYTAVKRGRKKKKDEGQLVLLKWNEEDEARKVIEQNIFGVDINEESVEITKLSLFLKIARKNRKLMDLSGNIKCGNSLIDDKSVDNKAFDWEKQFPFKFDIVIGNPPYVRQERFTEIKPHLEKTYKVYSGVADLYTYFYERGILLLKDGGLLGYISSNKWMKVKYGEGLRKLLKTQHLIRLIDFFELKVFEDAATEPIIVVLKNKASENKRLAISLIETLKFTDFGKYLADHTFYLDQTCLEDDGWSLSKTESKGLIGKLKADTISLGEFVSKKIYSGIKTGANHILVIDCLTYDALLKKDKRSKEIIRPLIEGVNIHQFSYALSDKYLIVTKKGTDISEYPAVNEYLEQYKAELAKRSDIVGKGRWFELRQCAYYDEFDQNKIVYIHTARRHQFAFDSQGNYVINNCYFIVTPSKYLLAFLNSKLFEYYKINTFVAFGDASGKGRCKLDYNKMIKVPIKNINAVQEKRFDGLVNEIILETNNVHNFISKFLLRIQTEFGKEKISAKLDNFYVWDSNKFLKELQKLSEKQLLLTQKDEWEDYFNKYKKEILGIKEKIDKIDSEIDGMIYDLYELTNDEKKIIEESLK